jgi:hypothetical protein
MIAVPDATQLWPPAVDALRRLRGMRLVLAGDGLANNCNGQATPPGQVTAFRATALLLAARRPSPFSH